MLFILQNLTLEWASEIFRGQDAPLEIIFWTKVFACDLLLPMCTTYLIYKKIGMIRGMHAPQEWVQKSVGAILFQSNMVQVQFSLCNIEGVQSVVGAIVNVGQSFKGAIILGAISCRNNLTWTLYSYSQMQFSLGVMTIGRNIFGAIKDGLS